MHFVIEVNGNSVKGGSKVILLFLYEHCLRPLPTVPLQKRILAFRAPLHITILGRINLIYVIDYITPKNGLGN